jgi:acyl-CoA synthetase (AMP-forming)/AMP-acid ligase II
MDMLACISYTSGSTGEPRGVRLSHRNLIRNAELNVRYLGISPADRVCLVLPLHFGMNRTSLLACFLAGATVVLENGMLDPNGLLATMRREAVTSLSAVPSVVATLLGRGDWRATRVPSLRSVRIGAGRVTAPMLQGLQLAFPGVQVYLTYGLTEVGLVAVLPPQQAMAKPQSCGQVLPEIRLRVLPPAGRPGANGEGGEIVILAPHIAQGYEEDPEGTRAIFQADGVHTGDLGWLDSEGFLHLTGRAKELIKRGSENINPREIEEYLLRHPAVAECAVIGVPDPWLGEAVKAFVVPAPGHALANGELRRFCLRGLSPIKRPSQIVCCSSLPRGAAGKVDKQALHQHEARSRTEIREDTPGPGDPHGRHRRLLEDHG